MLKEEYEAPRLLAWLAKRRMEIVMEMETRTD